MVENLEGMPYQQNNPHCWTILTPSGESSCFRPAPDSSLTDEAAETGRIAIGCERFQKAQDLSAYFAPPARRLVVLPENRDKRDLKTIRNLNCGALLVHPNSGGTASAVFMALTHVIGRDRNATVVLDPLEHYVPMDESVVNAVNHAVDIVERIPKKAILLAGDRPTDDPNCLWIQPGQKYRGSLSQNLWTVKSMTEKSNILKSGEGGGRLYYKSMVVAKAALIWKLGLWCMPELAASLAPFYDGIHETDQGIEELEPALFKNGGAGSFTERVLMRILRYLAALRVPENN